MLRNALFLSIVLCFTLKNLPAQTKKLKGEKVNTTSVPFFSFGGMLLIRAIADGQEGYFILDTGAPNLILNEKYFSHSGGVFQEQAKVVDINGRSAGLWTKNAKLQIGDQKWKNVYALLYDLAYLEEAKGISILGLIGSLLFRNYELTIDFELQELLLCRLDKQGEKLETFYDYRPPDVIVPFKRKGHMPYIEAELEGNTFNLGIDSGAGVALIIHEKQAALSPFAKPGDFINIRGLNQNTELVQVFQLHHLKVANLSYHALNVAFADLKHINTHFAGLDLDGILGLDLLSRHRTAINFRKKEIYIWTPEEPSEHLVLSPLKNLEGSSVSQDKDEPR